MTQALKLTFRESSAVSQADRTYDPQDQPQRSLSGDSNTFYPQASIYLTKFGFEQDKLYSSG